MKVAQIINEGKFKEIAFLIRDAEAEAADLSAEGNRALSGDVILDIAKKKVKALNLSPDIEKQMMKVVDQRVAALQTGK